MSLNSAKTKNRQNAMARLNQMPFAVQMEGGTIELVVDVHADEMLCKKVDTKNRRDMVSCKGKEK